MRAIILLGALLFAPLLANDYVEAETILSQSEDSQFTPYSAEVKEEQAPVIAWVNKPAKEEEQKPEPKWYFEVKPGYYYLTNSETRQFYGTGDFTIRGEAGYQLWGPVNLWFDGGYFHADGSAVGGPGTTSLMLATLSFGFKCLWYPHELIALYIGAAPRLFMMMLHNDSPFVRSDDNEFGIGGGFQGGFWISPIPSYKNFFLDIFADYSLMTMEVEPDEISSADYDVNVSGLSFGLGVGVRF